MHNADPANIIQVNMYGTKMTTDAILPMVSEENGRVVSVASGAGPMWVANQSEAEQDFWKDSDISIMQLIAKVDGVKETIDAFGAYGMSKAAVSSLTMIWAENNPKILFSSISPGLVDTAIVKGADWGAKSTPKEGSASIRHCLFNELKGSGYFYGSDCKRSPVHKAR
jgi:NAD(P)-dependent dehydrogenase (short-subunit alcohol dehydrogenase family)